MRSEAIDLNQPFLHGFNKHTLKGFLLWSDPDWGVLSFSEQNEDLPTDHREKKNVTLGRVY